MENHWKTIIEEHNYFVKQELERAEIINCINLTNILISREKIIRELE